MTASITRFSDQAKSGLEGSIFSDQIRFVGLCSLIVFACATFCGLAPIALSIATVFLFAGPHNWMELRYFLSRFPARLGNLKLYFATGMIGAFSIAVVVPLIAVLGKSGVIDMNVWITAYKLSNLAMVGWICSLVLIRHPELSTKRHIALGVIAALSIALIMSSPGYFAVGLVYLHPLVSLVMLDMELRRSKPHLVAPYRWLLTLIPLMLVALWWQLAASPSIAVTDPLVAQIIRHAGADYLTGVSTHFLVASHTFLETLHYAVWLVAIPLMSAGWNKWRPRSMPIAVVSKTSRALVRTALVFSTFAVAVLWFCFGVDFNIAREWYFLLAMIHVMAEIPFLIRFL